MLRPVVMSILCFFPVISFGQISNVFPFAGSQLLQSGILLGTEHDRYYSLRMQALGGDLSGTIEDQTTDLYRNPAYFAKVASPFTFGELVRPNNTQEYGPQLRTNPGLYASGPYFPVRTPDDAGKSTGLRYAYIANIGILLRGNYHANSSETSSLSNGLSGYSYYGSFYNAQSGTSMESQTSWGDVQFSYGWTAPSKILTVGISYTFGLSEAKNTFNSFNRLNIVSPRGQPSYFDSTWSGNQDTRNIADHLRSHTVRLGLRWDNPDNQIEAIGSVEALNGTSEQVQLENTESFDGYRYMDTARLYVSYHGSFQDVRSTASMRGTNIRLDFRYHEPLEEGRTFTAQLGGSVAFFSSEDSQNNLSRSTDTSGQWYTQGTTLLTQLTRTGSPNGFGFQVNARTGWTLLFDPFLLAAATVVNASHLTYDYDAPATQGDTLTQWSSGSASVIRSSGENKTIGHSHSVLILRLAVPIALEVEALKELYIRAGWVPQYVRNVNKDDSNDNGFRNTSDNLDVTTMTFGVGYQILKKLRVDMVNYGDLAQPRSWNIAAQYTF